MDYEKKYKEANDKVAARFGTNVAKEIFSDLYESEDERTRKELINFVENWRNHNPNSPFDDYPIYTSDERECNKILAWLEKQGEQKPWSEEDAFRTSAIANSLEISRYGNTHIGETLEEAAKNHKSAIHIVSPQWTSEVENAFIAGAEWQKKQTIDKACSWLRDYQEYPAHDIDTDKLIKAFKEYVGS